MTLIIIINILTVKSFYFFDYIHIFFIILRLTTFKGVLLLSFKKHIHDVTKSFFLSTHVPIQAFTYDGELIHSKGYNDAFTQLFDNYNIYEQLNEKILAFARGEIATVSPIKNIYFSAYPICSRNPLKGIFVLGPYSSCEKNNIMAIYKSKSLMPHLLSFLETLCKDCPNRPIQTPPIKPYSLHVKKAIDYMEARYMETISLPALCDYLNISKPYFCSIFKEETNKTFTEFLNRVRVDKSKELLLEGNLSVLDIALSVGYNNQNYYNINFKKITNKTPLEFKKTACCSKSIF